MVHSIRANNGNNKIATIICTRIKTVHAHTETVLVVNLFGNTDFIDKNNIRN